MATLTDLAAWLRARLGSEDLPTLYRPGREDVHLLGLALDARDVADAAVDAVFLHRPFQVGGKFAGAGVLCSHEGFDRELTTAENWTLARRLGWTHVRPFAWKSRTLGLIGTPPEGTWDDLLDALRTEFGGVEETLEPRAEVLGGRFPGVALMSAMRPELLGAVRDLGAGVYLTGQFRAPARSRAAALGLGVVALGHGRSELWGLRQLAYELAGAFPDVQVRLLPTRQTSAHPPRDQW